MAQHQTLSNLHQRFFYLVDYKMQIEKMEIKTGGTYEEDIALINELTIAIAIVRIRIKALYSHNPFIVNSIKTANHGTR